MLDGQASGSYEGSTWVESGWRLPGSPVHDRRHGDLTPDFLESTPQFSRGSSFLRAARGVT